MAVPQRVVPAIPGYARAEERCQCATRGLRPVGLSSSIGTYICVSRKMYAWKVTRDVVL